MSNLVKRGLTGAIYVLSVIVAIFINPILCSVYFFIVSIIGLWEFYNVTSKNTNIKPNNIFGFLLAVLIYGVFVFLQNDLRVMSMGIVGAILTLIFLVIAELYIKSEKPFTNIAYTLLGVVYVVIPLALTNLLVNFNGKSFIEEITFSPMILMSVFIFAWCNDTFAYLTGMKFGKHKLFERISPKKTWEGWIGGFLATIVAAVIVARFSDTLSCFDFIAIAIITSVIGTFGDLVESMFKRQMGVKDSGNILPGHGGILDRFDILLLVLPAVVTYFLIKTLLYI